MQAELYDALLEGGTSEPKARAAAEAAAAYPKAGELATKSDIAGLQANLTTVETSLRADINLLRWMIGFNLALTAAGVVALILR